MDAKLVFLSVLFVVCQAVSAGKISNDETDNLQNRLPSKNNCIVLYCIVLYCIVLYCIV